MIFGHEHLSGDGECVCCLGDGVVIGDAVMVVVSLNLSGGRAVSR